MNLTNKGAVYGFTQYCYPKDYELNGKNFVLKSDVCTYTISFQHHGFVTLTTPTKEILSQYEALKIDNDTHIVFFGEDISVVVLDLAGGYATLKKSADSVYEFCAIEDMANCGNPHCFTDDMTDTHVKWVFGCERYIENTYLEGGKCKCIWSPREDRPRTIPAEYIKIKDGIYLVELNSTSPFRTDIPQGFSKIVMLQDYDHLLTVGCIYSPALNEFRLISGYAMSPDDKLF